MEPRSFPFRPSGPCTAVVLAAVLAFGSARAALAQGEDAIVVRDNGSTKSVTGVHVESHTYETVVYDDGRKQEIPGAKVVEIRFGDTPREYATGRRALAAGSGDRAVKDFTTCLKGYEATMGGESQMRPWVLEYAQFGLGEAYRMQAAQDPGALDKAVEAYEAARKANPKSLLLSSILQGLADAELGRGKPQDGLRAAEDLVKIGRESGNVSWQVDGHLTTARVHMGKRAWNDAVRAYDELERFLKNETASAQDPQLKSQLADASLDAAANKGWVLVEKAIESKSMADFEAARGHFEQLPAAFGQAPEALAARSNANGVIKLAQGQVGDALRDFQYTEVALFTVPAEVARSLYYQAECWQKLGKEDRRAARLSDLKEYHPKSEWARKVR